MGDWQAWLRDLGQAWLKFRLPEGALPPSPPTGQEPVLPGEGLAPGPAMPTRTAPAKAERLVLADPPRGVPPLVRLANLFGGFINQFGWVWCGFTMFFAWVFLANMDWTGLYHFSGRLDTAPGTIVESAETNFSENDAPVYSYRYRFVGPDGVQRAGISYVTGGQLGAGSAVTIEFPRGNPSVSRIRGMHRGKLGFTGVVGILLPAFLVVFMSVGVGCLAAGLRAGLKANRLLATGKLALGKLKSKEATRTQINNCMVYKFTFVFKADDGRMHEAVAKTHLVENLTDAAGEYLLYDPLDPSYAVMLDTLSGGVQADEWGQLQPRSAVRAAASLIVPALVATVHGVIAYFVWLR